MARRTEKLDAQQRHQMRMGWFIAEAHRQAGNRAMRAKCERYYDSEQISATQRAEVEARGQEVVIFNEVKPTIDWLIGTERRTRIDFRVMPRDSIDRESTQDAEIKTKVLKWLADTNRAGFERSYAFDDAMKAGLGWLEVGVRGDTSDVPIYINAEPWRNMLHDSIGGSRMDLTDSRYVFRIKVVDLDIALSYFPDKEKELRKVRQDGSDLQAFSTWMAGSGTVLDLGLLNGSAWDAEDHAVPPDLFNPRERVLLVECWSVEPDNSPQRSSPSVYDRQRMSMRVSIMTEYDTLMESWSPYKHGRFPFIPVWAYRNKRTGLPYSPVWPLVDKQDALNSAMSKALYEAGVNQTVAEVDAFENGVMTPEEAHAEMQDPQGMVLLKAGALVAGKFESRRGTDLAKGQLMMAEQFRMGIRDGGSVTDANKGRETNATSGKAIGLQQDQGSVLSTELFDNALLARQMEGELSLSLAEQYMQRARAVALPGERRQSQMVEINKPGPDGTILNDITQRSAQFVIGEQAWRQTLAQAAFESLMEMLGNLAPVAPQVVVSMLDLVFEYADLPNKEAMLERIRTVTGQPGPDNQQTPEQIAAAQKKAALEEETFKLQLEQLRADVAEAVAKGEKLNAEAMRQRLEALYMAAQGGQVLAMAPGIAPLADELLASAGFQDQNAPGVLDGMPQPQAQPAPPIPDPLQTDGAMAGSMAGSQTPAPDGVLNAGV
jgi:hypothetical protein